MIYGIGHDIVENRRIDNMLNKYGQLFVNKILSDSEKSIFVTHKDGSRFLAKRYAAKEAFAKACGTGLRTPILMPHISVINDALGKPSFIFNIEIENWLLSRNIVHTHLSLTDEITLSSSFVILEVM